MMYNLIQFLSVIVVLSGMAVCRPSKPAPTNRLLPYFQFAQEADTLRFFIDVDKDSMPGDTIPNSLFFTAIDPVLLREIDYVVDSSGSLVLGRQRFPLNDRVDACLVDVRQSWYQHQSLLLFDKRLQAFTGRVTVAEWFGGDGGQLLTGSWMLDYDRDGHKDLIRREIQHSLTLLEEEARDTFYESAALLRWNGSRFAAASLSDTALVVKQFPIPSFW